MSLTDAGEKAFWDKAEETMQHVGKLSDSLSGEEHSTGRALQKALDALKRPIAQRRGPKVDLGDGPACPEPGNHGNMYVLGLSKHLWCPVTEAIYRNEKGAVGSLLRAGQEAKSGHER